MSFGIALTTVCLASPTETETVPVAQVGESVVARQSPIVWPAGKWQPQPSDKLALSSWFGGVAGTDWSEVAIFGDGRVTLKGSGDEADGHYEGTLTPEQTRQVFLRLRDSKILEKDELGLGPTGGIDLRVEIGGVKDQVSVVHRSGEAEALFKEARKVVKAGFRPKE